ncbi:MAG: hypothetical protein J6Y68_00395 [Clostridia bacterium]|nr:hypothetical protein [Clostridia bacterium]
MITNFINLEKQAKEIIELAQTLLDDKSCMSRNNRFVLGVVLREFTEILNILRSNRLLLLTSKRQPIGCLFIISDSAGDDFNRQLSAKIWEFEGKCSLVEERYKIYRSED